MRNAMWTFLDCIVLVLGVLFILMTSEEERRQYLDDIGEND